MATKRTIRMTVEMEVDAEGFTLEGIHNRLAELERERSITRTYIGARDLVRSVKYELLPIESPKQTKHHPNSSQEKAKPGNLYVVWYRIIGRRENGSYLVNAYNKREAKKLIKALDEDYVIVEVESIGEYASDLGFNSIEEARAEELLINDDKRWNKMVETYGDIHQLEEGT